MRKMIDEMSNNLPRVAMFFAYEIGLISWTLCLVPFALLLALWKAATRAD